MREARIGTHPDDDSRNEDGGDWLYLLGRIAWRLLQAALVTAGIVLVFSVVVRARGGGGGGKERAYIAAMSSDLRRLVTAQAEYFAENMVYAPSLKALGYQASAGVTVAIDRVAADGWAASATDSGTPYRCAIFIGTVTPPPQIGNARPGEPRCWKP